MDAIELLGLQVWAHHGVLAHERELGQPFVVDLRLSVDLAAAAASDDLADTVDYGGLAERVHALVAGERHDLIETVAGRVAELCLQEALVQQVEVTVRKPAAPLTVPAAEVSVTLRRRREPEVRGS